MRKPSESTILREILEALGAEPDLVLFRNSVGRAPMVDMATGKAYHITFGLGPGSPDIVGILRRETQSGVAGQWFCLEVKRPGAGPSAEQAKCAKVWRWYGAFVATVSSVEEAHDALGRARNGASS